MVEDIRNIDDTKAIAHKLSVLETLLECITILSRHEDLEKGMNHLLQVIREYFDSDRAYVFENNYTKGVTNNTYENVKKGVSRQIDFLQNVPLSAVEVWMEEFRKNGMFVISSLDTDVDKGSNTYEILSVQEIDSLIAIPLYDENKIVGFLGIDNPRKNFEDISLMDSVTYFLVDFIEKRKTQAVLERLSFMDSLTRLYNRNKYNIVLDSYENKKVDSLAIAYFDLNGLKLTNDRFGHKAGDALIQSSAKCIYNVFGDNSFRIGGDEFVVIVENISEEDFYVKVEKSLDLFIEREISTSYGVSWRGKDNDIHVQMQEADRRMYAHKNNYYENLRIRKKK